MEEIGSLSLFSPLPPSPEEGGDDDHPLFAILPCSIRAESDNTCTYWLRIALAYVKWQVDLGVDAYRNHQARGIYEYQTQTFWVVLKQRSRVTRGNLTPTSSRNRT